MTESINLVNKTPTNINRNNVKNNQTQESPEYKLLKDKLKPIFLETKDIFHKKNIDERIHLTRIQKLTILIIIIIIITIIITIIIIIIIIIIIFPRPGNTGLMSSGG